MENASKALLIAGAILIAIVLISLGVMILGQGSDAIKDNNMDSSQIAAYNQEYETLLGTNVRGNTVRQIITKVNQHNRSNKDDLSKQISIVLDTTKSTDTTAFDHTAAAAVITASQIGSGYSYTVTAQYSTGGLISKIHVCKNT